MSELQRLGNGAEWDAITRQLQEVKARHQRMMRMNPKPPKELGDYSHLNSTNLEELHWIDEARSSTGLMKPPQGSPSKRFLSVVDAMMVG
jgi:hypothetical protein